MAVLWSAADAEPPSDVTSFVSLQVELSLTSLLNESETFVLRLPLPEPATEIATPSSTADAPPDVDVASLTRALFDSSVYWNDESFVLVYEDSCSTVATPSSFAIAEPSPAPLPLLTASASSCAMASEDNDTAPNAVTIVPIRFIEFLPLKEADVFLA